MNSRHAVNEANLVDFTADLSSLNPLETKDGLLSFSFDHIYACHSDSEDARRETLGLDKDLDLDDHSGHCVLQGNRQDVVKANFEISVLSKKLDDYRSENQRLKNLTLQHLDLIQQQSDLILSKEKVLAGLKQENYRLKSRLSQADRRLTLTGQRSHHPPPLIYTPTSQPANPEKPQLTLNTFAELVISDNNTIASSFVFESDLKDPKYIPPAFSGNVTGGPDKIKTHTYTPSSSGAIPTVATTTSTLIPKTENRTGGLYSMTGTRKPTYSKFQKNGRFTSQNFEEAKSTMSRHETSSFAESFKKRKPFETNFGVNKKPKMIHTYATKNSKVIKVRKPMPAVGSLSDRLQLIDTTPTGEDPYTMGEADLREQSPIPKLMLQKNNQGKLKICGNEYTEKKPIYDPSNMKDHSDVKPISKLKTNRLNLNATYGYQNAQLKQQKAKRAKATKASLNIKFENDPEWSTFKPKSETVTANLCDYSYGENDKNLASNQYPPLDSDDFQNMFAIDPNEALNHQNFFSGRENKPVISRPKKPRKRTKSVGTAKSKKSESDASEPLKNERMKRARSVGAQALTELDNFKAEDGTKEPEAVAEPAKPVQKVTKRRASPRNKSPVPIKTVTVPYYTRSIGDPDSSWHKGADPDLDIDDLGQGLKETLEVPRWREKIVHSCYSMEGTENLDDEVFYKRHHKLEAYERRQKRWDVQRLREQRLVERLRQRQRDAWGGGAAPAPSGSLEPVPHRDVRYIEICRNIPVSIFGEPMLDLPTCDFTVPWVRSSKHRRQKRAKSER